MGRGYWQRKRMQLLGAAGALNGAPKTRTIQIGSEPKAELPETMNKSMAIQPPP